MTTPARITLLGCLLLAVPRLVGQEADVPVAVPVEEPEAPAAIPVAEPPVGPAFEPNFGDAVISESKQFRVRGGPGAARGSVAILADQARAEFLQLTGEANAGFKIPVIIQLVGNPGDPVPPRTVATGIDIGDQGYELRISIHTGRGLDVDAFQHAVTAALIYERTLANRPPDDDLDTPLLAPPWLVEGLREANRWRLGNGDRRLYDRLFQSGGFFQLDGLLETTEAAHDNLDGASRAAFEASSGALVMALLEQPDGLPAFRKFLGEVALYAGEMPSLLRRHFPELNLSENSMAKWWQLQLAAKGAAKLTESLTIAETEAALDQALILRFRDAEGEMRESSIADWSVLADLDETERFGAIRRAEDALVRLSYRCFPTHRPLLAAYQDVLNKIARNSASPGNVAVLLDELTATRQTLTAKAERGRDYLDWFEITRARETSGAFDDYLRLKADLRENPRTPRHDPITRTLDRFDAIFHRDIENPNLPGQNALGNLPPPDFLLPP
jgi:hypothetical protein